MEPDLDAAARAMRDFIAAVGAPVSADPELAGTPERVARAFIDELLDGYRADPAVILGDALASTESGLIAVNGIAYASVCPHHLLPSLGRAHVGYLPGGRIVGIGTLVRLVEAYAHRMVLQEALGQHIADALVAHLGARAAGVILDAQHLCLAARGERQQGARVVTQAFAGVWRDDPIARAEFLAASRAERSP